MTAAGEEHPGAAPASGTADPLAPWRAPWWLWVGIVAGGLLLFAYPFLIQQAEARFGTRVVATVFLGLGFLSYRGRGPALPLGDASRPFPVPFLGAFRLGCLALLVGALLSGDRRWLLVIPAAIQLFLTAVFVASLRDVPVIERAARFLQPRAPDFIRPYCRKVTAFWAGLFAVNAGLIAVLIFAGTPDSWRAFAGWGAYALMGVVTGVEYFVRKIWFRYYGAHPIDRLWARLLPPERTERGRRSLAYIRQMHDDMCDAGFVPPEEATPR